MPSLRLQSNFKRNSLIECITDTVIALTHLKWIMNFGWVKGHAGIEGNELVDKLAKATAMNEYVEEGSD